MSRLNPLDWRVNHGACRADALKDATEVQAAFLVDVARQDDTPSASRLWVGDVWAWITDRLPRRNPAWSLRQGVVEMGLLPDLDDEEGTP